MIEKIKEMVKTLNKLSVSKSIKVISHHDTDGITSAAIFSKALQRWNKRFSLEIVKNLEDDFIEDLPEDRILIFLDLASGSLPQISKKKTEVFILDHHEIAHDIPDNVTIINPRSLDQENVAASAICYLFAKTVSEANKDLANLAVIGMVGDMMEKNIGKVYDEIIKDAEAQVRRGIMLYPATRPLDRVISTSFGLYIPGVTGSYKASVELLRDAGIAKTPRGYKSLAELTDEEMSRLGTSIMLKKIGEAGNPDVVGNIYLVKFFNHVEDAREISAIINACSRMGHSDVALGLCLGNKEIKKEAEKVHAKYKKTISSALEQVSEMEKISGKNYTIVNAQDKLRDTIVGTVASIMSFSPLYPEGTVIIAMAYNENKIKVSARLAGRKGRNVREILHKATVPLTTEVGGHPNAAGCLVPREKEKELIENLKNTLEIELVKI